MNRKDYIKFAKMLAHTQPIRNPTYSDESYNRALRLWNEIKERIIEIFEEDNALFDRTKFENYIEKEFEDLINSIWEGQNE